MPSRRRVHPSSISRPSSRVNSTNPAVGGNRAHVRLLICSVLSVCPCSANATQASPFLLEVEGMGNLIRTVVRLSSRLRRQLPTGRPRRSSRRLPRGDEPLVGAAAVRMGIGHIHAEPLEFGFGFLPLALLLPLDHEGVFQCPGGRRKRPMCPGCAWGTPLTPCFRW